MLRGDGYSLQSLLYIQAIQNQGRKNIFGLDLHAAHAFGFTRLYCVLSLPCVTGFAVNRPLHSTLMGRLAPVEHLRS